MKLLSSALLAKSIRLSVAACIACCTQVIQLKAQPIEPKEPAQFQTFSNQSDADKYSSIRSSYILGPGDSIAVELLDIPEYSGVFTVSPDGTLYVPRLRSIFVEGLTVDQLRNHLTEQFRNYVREPQIFITVDSYRPIRVYIGGEVARPGFYYLSDQQSVSNGSGGSIIQPALSEIVTGNSFLKAPFSTPSSIGGKSVNRGLRLPTVFDALRSAGGITPFSNLSKVSVTRNLPRDSGGKKIRTTLDFIPLITEGNESQNIRLFDGDSVHVARSKVEMREQIIKAGQSNLSPDFIQVFVTGRVREPGSKVLPQGSSLDQAIASAGGQKLIRGQVEFIRFNRNGTTDRRKFFVGSTNPAGSYKNPILMAGDLVRVNDSPLSATLTVLEELSTPSIGIYSMYSLIRGF